MVELHNKNVKNEINTCLNLNHFHEMSVIITREDVQNGKIPSISIRQNWR